MIYTIKVTATAADKTQRIKFYNVDTDYDFEALSIVQRRVEKDTFITNIKPVDVTFDFVEVNK